MKHAHQYRETPSYRLIYSGKKEAVFVCTVDKCRHTKRTFVDDKPIESNISVIVSDVSR